MVLLEAMAAGLPVIATRVGGVPSVVEPACGELVAPACPEELADAMARFLRGFTARELGSKAREIIRRRYSVVQMVSQYIELYEHVADA